jgi:hypothetical protein
VGYKAKYIDATFFEQFVFHIKILITLGNQLGSWFMQQLFCKIRQVYPLANRRFAAVGGVEHNLNRSYFN